MRQLFTGFFVVAAAVSVTAFSIDAFDTYSGEEGTLLAQLMMAKVECPMDMVLVTTEFDSYCIDRYEVSTGERCNVLEPKSVYDTTSNLSDSDCEPVSILGAQPWRYVSYTQAVQLCARAGKFLPSAGLWYTAALGTPDSDQACILSGSLADTGSKSACVAGSGAYDMIGNVWELVATSPTTEQLDNEAGYVSGIDAAGVVNRTASTSATEYGEDYFWRAGEGSVLLRGGFYGARSDGGIYSTQAGISPDFSSAAIGFRCARSL